MSIKGIIISKAARAGLVLQKYSPQIALATGIVGFGTTVVLSGRAAVKAKPVREETKALLQEARMAKLEASKDEDSSYDDKTYRQDIARSYGYALGKLSKIYAPTLIVGGVSLAALIAGHKIQADRLSQITAAYTGLQASFDKYRELVAEKLSENGEDGEAAEREVMEALTTEVPNQDMPTKFWFSSLNSKEWSDTRFANLQYLEDVQNAMNRRLNDKGHLFLNDVLAALGIDPLPVGQQIGWIQKLPEGRSPDLPTSFVDFGIGISVAEESDRLRDRHGRHEADLLLDFNVDGVIWNHI